MGSPRRIFRSSAFAGTEARNGAPEKLWQSAQLPTLPTVAVRLLELSQSSDTEIRDIVEVAKSDPAISAKLLKSANAAYFGLSHKVTTIERAVPRT